MKTPSATARISVCIFFFLLVVFSGRSQTASIYVNSNFQSIKSKSFIQFSEEYNSYLSGSLTKKLDPTRIGAGWGMGGMICFVGVKMGIEFNRVSCKTTAEFSDGASREFKLTDRGLGFFVGYSPGELTQEFYFYPVFGVTLGKNKLQTVYTAGSSANSGTFLDGNYVSSSTKTFVGFHTAFGKENFKFLLQVEYVGKLLPDELIDEDKTNSSTSTNRIGQDYAVFVANTNSYEGKYVESDFRGLRIGIGVSIDFGD